MTDMTSNAEYPLHEAVNARNEELVQRLIETGWNVNDLDSNGRTPLHYTAYRPFIRHYRDSEGRPIIFAPMNEQEVQSRIRIAILLINAGAQIDRPSNNFWDGPITALQEAALRQNNPMVKLFLQYGADIHAKTGNCGNTALHCALMFNNRENDNLVITLLEHGAQVNAVNHKDETPLHLAAKKTTAELYAKQIPIEHGADIDDQLVGNENTWQLVMRPFRVNVNFVKILLEHGSYVNAFNGNGETPLHLTAMNSFRCPIELVELLLEYGAEIDKKRLFLRDNAFEIYAIMDRLYLPDPTLLKLFLFGNNRENHRMSPLHEACMLHKVDLVRDMLQEGTDLTAEDCFGRVPMHYAIIVSTPSSEKIDKRATLKLLLEYGADGDQNSLFPKIRHKPLDSDLLCDIFSDYATKRTILHDLSVDKIVQCREGLVLRKFALSRLSGDDIRFSFQMLVEDYVPPEVVQSIFSTDNSGNELFKELRLMKETKIGESEVSFLDVLDASPEKIANYARNKKLVQEFEAGKNKFQKFKGILEANFYKGPHMELAKSAAETLSILLCSDYSLELYFQKYLAQYSNEELKRLIE